MTYITWDSKNNKKITTNKKLHAKLVQSSSPPSLLERCCKRCDCHQKRKTILGNFSSYIRNFRKNKNILSYILDIIYKICFKKPIGKPKYSINHKSFTLCLYVTSHIIASIKKVGRTLSPTIPYSYEKAK